MKCFSIFLMLSLFFSGCANVSQQKKISPQAQKDYLIHLLDWRASGRFSFSDGKMATQGNFEWRQHKQCYNILLHGPLGAETTKIHGTEDNIALTTSKGEVFSAQSAQALMLEKLGWSMPINSLSFWSKGLIAPSSKPSKLRIGPNHQLQLLEQQGWQIDYQAFGQYGMPVEMPKKIILKKENLCLKFIFQSWD